MKNKNGFLCSLQLVSEALRVKRCWRMKKVKVSRGNNEIERRVEGMNGDDQRPERDCGV